MRKGLMLILMVLAVKLAWADTIQLKSGRIVKGRIVTQTPVFVRIETNEAIRTQEFLTSKIEKIIRGDDMSSSLEESPAGPPPVIDTLPVKAPPQEPSAPKVGQPVASSKNIFTNEDLLSIQRKTDEETGFYELKAVEPNVDTSLTLSGWAVCGIIFSLMLLLAFGKGKKKEKSVTEEQIPLATYGIHPAMKPSLEPPDQDVSQTAAAPAEQVLSMRRLISMSASRAHTILFAPFNLKKWLLLLLMAVLSGALFSGNFTFHTGGDLPKLEAAGPATGGPIQLPPLFKRPAAGRQHSLPILLFVLGIIMGGILLFLLFMWLGARFQFIWYNAIVKNDASIKEPFRIFKKAGNSLFKFYFFLGLVTVTVLLGLGIWLFFIIKDSGVTLNQFHNWSWKTWVNLFGPPIVALILVFLFFIVLSRLVHDFVIPIMALDEVSFRPAWHRFLEIYRSRMKEFWKYLLVYLGLAILTAIMIVLLMIAIGLTVVIVLAAVFGLLYFLFIYVLKAHFLFKMLAIVLAVPAVITLLLIFLSVGLPFAVFFRSFALYFLTNLKCGYAPL